MELTNILLSALLTLIGGIAVVFWNEIKQFQKEVQELFKGNIENRKDIETLRDNVDNHEGRIIELEKNN